MENNTKRLILLLSLILIIVPMVVFPNRMGMTLASGSTIYMFSEIVYYGFVLYLFRRDISLVALIVGSALTFVYRMALGAVFGLAIIMMYGIESSIAFSLGVTKYLPAVLLHVASAPFIMRAVYLQLAADMVPPQNKRISRPTPIAEDFAPVNNNNPVTGINSKAVNRPVLKEFNVEQPTGPTLYSDDENLFERAIAYLGEIASVRMALLVTEEGLVLARMSRCDEDGDLWAPLAISLESGIDHILDRFQQRSQAEGLDLSTQNKRIILRRVEHVILMILADPDIDETIHIRIAQATDMVRKYMSERYSPAAFARVEDNYVSNS
ncbi:MAG: hypothetical protein GY841_13290 [FCB group bacterium]|nr:hypothetical protein [FCB group bacterium]